MAPAPPPEVPERKRRQVDERAVRREEVLASLGSFLDDAVKDLQERGTTVIAVPDAMLSARVVRFRWGDSVLEIDGRRGSGAGFEHRARLGRQDAKKQAEILKRYLTDGLADLAADS